MSDGNGHNHPNPVTLTPAQQSFWLLYQIYKNRALDTYYINLRAIHNPRPTVDPTTGRLLNKDATEALFNQNIPVKSFKDTWLTGLYDAMRALNMDSERPSNIYYGVNPRTHPKKNTKAEVPLYLSYYLDFDVNENYTLEMRAKQIDFLIACGFDPSFVVFSGHGYHPYYVLEVPVDGIEGQALIKRLVAITGCKLGGNIHDVTRVLRLPGFDNVKEWYKDDRPPCMLVYPAPEVITNSFHSGSLMRRYKVDELEYLPPCQSEDIARYLNQAQALPGNPRDNLRNIIWATIAQRQQAKVNKAARDIVDQDNVTVAETRSKIERAAFEPTLTSLPPDLGDIPFPKSHAGWMRTYCHKGFDGLTPLELDKIKNKLTNPDISASELDYYVIYHLCKRGYTEAAIREFWMRPSLKLYRPDKEARSPDYFSMSYAKALKSVQDTMETPQTPQESAQKAAVSQQVMVMGYQTFIRRGVNTNIAINGEIIVKSIYEDIDAEHRTDREYYETDVRTQNPLNEAGFDQWDQLIPRRAFNSPAAFREECHGRFCLLTNKAEDLQMIVMHMHYAYPNAERKRFHSKLTYANDTFVLPHMTITKDGFQTQKSFELTKNLRKAFPWHDSFVKSVISKPELKTFMREVWPHLLRVHMPRLIGCFMGSLVASTLRAILLEKKITPSMQIPTLNIRGKSVRGKTETVKLLYRIIGFTDDSAILSCASSNFALSRFMEKSNFIPLIVDEFKNDGPDTRNSLNMIRGLVRRSYSGETVLKGKADLSVTAWNNNNAMMVVGEEQLERTGNVSEISRIVPIITDEWSMDRSIAHYQAIQRAPLGNIGPHLLQFILTLDHEQLYQRLEGLRRELTSKLSDSFGDERMRIGNNLATLIWGCSVLDQFVDSVDPTLPKLLNTFNSDEIFVTDMKSWSIESGQSLVYTNKQTQKKVVTTRDELFEFVYMLSQMILSNDSSLRSLKDDQITFYFRDEKRNELGLSFSMLYQCYRTYCLNHRFEYLEEAKLKSLLRAAHNTRQPWLLNKDRVCKRKNGAAGRFVILDLEIMRTMGLWHDAGLEPQNSYDVQSDEAQNTTKNPNTEPLPRFGRFLQN